MKQRIEARNHKIITAVIEKARRCCPGSLALLGVYGSCMTGDIHEKSDLDLFILINDDAGWKLGCGFIEEDCGVGHDLYCLTWDALEGMAAYTDPNISRLMDADIVYCEDEAYYERLMALRKKVTDTLTAPFSKEDFDKAAGVLKEAEHSYAQCMLAEDHEPEQVNFNAGTCLYHLSNAIALLNKTYFKRGVRRTYEELNSMPKRPENLCALMEDTVCAVSPEQRKQRLTALMRAVKAVFAAEGRRFAAQKQAASRENLAGTYEEFFSNWRNKMQLAAAEHNPFLAFMSMCSAQDMLEEIKNEVELPPIPLLAGYDPADLAKTADVFDEMLAAYQEVYREARIPVAKYPNIDAFVEEYLRT